MLPAPSFHHLHLNSVDPDAAIEFYVRQFPASAKAYWGGLPALAAPRDVLVLFSRVATAPATPPQTTTCKVARRSDRTWPALDRAGMFRAPAAAVVFGDVALPWYLRQGDRPLVSSRGHVYDHIALSVGDLDAWVAKLRGERVTFLEEAYELGDTRAVMIEGPSREALELVEIA